ncbi:MAG: hypothetical protein ACRD3G_07525 [Vicinamibacterales bacterium]
MRPSRLSVVGAAVLVLVGFFQVISIADQSTAATRKWTMPRTPWGDPDVSGIYSNSDESGIPFERPARFEGRRLEDITPRELEDLRAERRKATAASSVDENRPVDREVFWENLNAVNSRAWLVVDPPDGKIPPTTSQALQRAAARAEARSRSGRGPADSAADRSLYDRCISRGLPGSMMPAIYGSSYEIVQSPSSVAIVYEMVHEARVIPLDRRAHVGTAIRTYMGDARGHWDGDTLVVETTNIKEAIAYRNASLTLRLIERFTPIAEGLEWSVTLDDPATWTRPWTFAMVLTKKDASQRPFEYACHEGNYGLRNILSAARAEEAAQAGRNGK